jgi:tRNA threonylcarbamoyladenosine biosynthesis protein TsaE
VKETREVSGEILEIIRNEFGGHEGVVIVLSGELGTGKTEIVKGIAEKMSFPKDTVTSPTFTIMQEYVSRRHDGADEIKILHVDMYRVDEDAEGDIVGMIEEKLDQGYLVAVEWGEKLPSELFSKKIIVKIHFGEEENERDIEISW